jgi:hypothetical protein
MWGWALRLTWLDVVLTPCVVVAQDEWYYDPAIPYPFARYCPTACLAICYAAHQHLHSLVFVRLLCCCSFVVHEGVTAFNADILIWNRKTYFHKPLLVLCRSNCCSATDCGLHSLMVFLWGVQCSGDGPIAQVRRWFRQFYNSHTLLLPPVPPRSYDTQSWEEATAAPPAAAGEDRKEAEPVSASA